MFSDIMETFCLYYLWKFNFSLAYTVHAGILCGLCMSINQ